MSDTTTSVASTPVVSNTPAGEGTGAYVVQEAVATPASGTAEGDLFAKAVAQLEALDPKAEPSEPQASEAEPVHEAVAEQEAAKKAELAKKEPVDDKFASKFEQLRKAGADVERQRAEWKAEKDKLAKYEDAQRLAKVDLNAALELLGISQEELTSLALKGGALSEDTKIALEAKSEVKKLREAQEQRARDEQAARQAQDEQVFKNEIAQFIKGSEAHELTANMRDGGVSAVKAIIEEHWHKTFDPTEGRGEVMSYAAAADQVEKQLEQELERFTKAKKWAAKSGTQAKQATQPASKTLTGSMTGRTAPGKEMTEADRMAQAERMLKDFWK